MNNKSIKAVLSKINLKNTNKLKNNYNIQKVDEVSEEQTYEGGIDFNVLNLINGFIPNKNNNDNNDNNYVIKVLGQEINLEEQLDSAINNLPFEVILSDSDKKELLNIIKANPVVFLPLTKKNPSLQNILNIVRYLNKKTDISYSRISKIVPDIENVIKTNIDPYLGDILTIDYSNMGLLWDALLSNKNSKINTAIDKVFPNFESEIVGFINDKFGVVVDPEEVDTVKIVSNFVTNLEENLEKVEALKKRFDSGNVNDKISVITDGLIFFDSLGLTLGDIAHIVYDTQSKAVSNNVTNFVGDIPYVGTTLLDVGAAIGDGYNFVAENSQSIPLVGGGIHYIMTTDIVDKAEDAFEVGSTIADGAYNMGCDLIDELSSLLRW